MLYFEVIATRGCIEEEKEAYITYGIAIFEVKDGEYRRVMHVKDITLEPEVALRFAETCNEEQPDLLHMPEIIEDFLP